MSPSVATRQGKRSPSMPIWPLAMELGRLTCLEKGRYALFTLPGGLAQLSKSTLPIRRGKVKPKDTAFEDRVVACG